VTKALMNPLTARVGEGSAGSVAGLGVFFLPGLAGFLVWEFRKLAPLQGKPGQDPFRPVMIGHHGETMPRLLRRLHSGTLPKLFAKLRKTRRRAERTGRWEVVPASRKTHSTMWKNRSTGLSTRVAPLCERGQWL